MEFVKGINSHHIEGPLFLYLINQVLVITDNFMRGSSFEYDSCLRQNFVSFKFIALLSKNLLGHPWNVDFIKFIVVGVLDLFLGWYLVVLVLFKKEALCALLSTLVFQIQLKIWIIGLKADFKAIYWIGLKEFALR